MAAFVALYRFAYSGDATEELNRKTQEERILAIVDRLADATARESGILDHLVS